MQRNFVRNSFSDENFRRYMCMDFLEKSFSDENFRRYMCMDFLEKSFSDEIFRRYMYQKIVFVTKNFVTKYDLIN